MTKNASLLDEMVEVDDMVEVGEGMLTQIKGMGILCATVVAGGKNQEIVASDVAFVPSLTTNLFSMSCLRCKGLFVVFGEDNENPNTGIVAITKRIGGEIIAKRIE